MITTTIHNQLFYLHPTGAIYWEAQKMLLIADVHLGKVAHFRKNGSAVPQQVIEENFNRLDEALTAFTIDEVCFLGDLFHSHMNSEWLLFEQWIRSKKSRFSLVTGNHDIINPLRFEQLGFQLFDARVIDRFLLTHEPREQEGLFTFCGHIHPGILLHGAGKQRLRLPCFFKQQQQLILPAFGTFTGLYILEPTVEDQVYAIAENEVVLVS